MDDNRDLTPLRRDSKEWTTLDEKMSKEWEAAPVEPSAAIDFSSLREPLNGTVRSSVLVRGRSPGDPLGGFASCAVAEIPAGSCGAQSASHRQPRENSAEAGTKRFKRPF